MGTQIDVGIEGRLGVIALNRPQAIHALSQEMIDGISKALRLWADDPQVRAVLFEARGGRGFCAGGDVRAVRAAVLAGDAAAVERFFASEYAMNLQIARYGKPVAVIADGIVMGGGIGIAGHCRYRFTTPKSTFAMPEAAIGFVCDVGVNALLAKAPLHRALLFELSGQTVGAADAIALGLSDCVVPPERLDTLRAGIVDAAATEQVETALAGLMQAESIDAGDRKACDLYDRLEEVKGLETAAEIVWAVDRSGVAPDLARLLKARSPTSQHAIRLAHLASRSGADIADILGIDLGLAMFMTRHPDFAEGVRAVLVDKDQSPRWHADVPFREVAELIAAASPI